MILMTHMQMSGVSIPIQMWEKGGTNSIELMLVFTKWIVVISGLFIAWKQTVRILAESPLFFNNTAGAPARALPSLLGCHSHQAGSSNCEPLKLQGHDVTCWRLAVCCDRIIGPWYKGSICCWLWELCHLMSRREIINSGKFAICLNLSGKSS
jgi:hypothetical protein